MNPSDRLKTVQELKTKLEKLSNVSNDTNNTLNTLQKNFVPPGFRTKTPWKMLAASVGYAVIFWVCLLLFQLLQCTTVHSFMCK